MEILLLLPVERRGLSRIEQIHIYSIHSRYCIEWWFENSTNMIFKGLRIFNLEFYFLFTCTGLQQPILSYLSVRVHLETSVRTSCYHSHDEKGWQGWKLLNGADNYLYTMKSRAKSWRRVDSSRVEPSRGEEINKIKYRWYHICRWWCARNFTIMWTQQLRFEELLISSTW